MIKLLIVDDSPLMRRLLGQIFREEGDFVVAFARDGVDALAQVDAFEPDVITLDVTMPNMDGLTFLDRLMIERPRPVVMVSSLTEAGAMVTLQALDLGAVDFFAKPERAVSLEIETITPLLVEKVRTAAGARLAGTHRLKERVRLRSGLNQETKPVPRRSAPQVWSPAKIREPAADGVVLVGASTGGPPALDALLGALPRDFPWPILVAQHMPASFTGPFARRLDRLCALSVVEVQQPMPVAPGHVYIAKGDADMIVGTRPTGLVVLAAPALPELRWHPSVDRLVGSALDHIEASRLVGILMTGMGHDGAATMTRLRAEGGRTIAEAEETAVVWGMPGELVKAGGAEIVAPLERIADHLLALVGRA